MSDYNRGRTATRCRWPMVGQRPLHSGSRKSLRRPQVAGDAIRLMRLDPLAIHQRVGFGRRFQRFDDDTDRRIGFLLPRQNADPPGEIQAGDWYRDGAERRTLGLGEEPEAPPLALPARAQTVLSSSNVPSMRGVRPRLGGNFSLDPIRGATPARQLVIPSWPSSGYPASKRERRRSPGGGRRGPPDR